MKIEVIVIAIIALILLVVIGGPWIFSQFQSSNEKHWIDLAVWSGQETNYNMTTDQFVITVDEWSIGWNSTTMVWGSYFDITVYDVNTGNMVRKIEPSVGQTHYGVNYLDAKGTFYLHIFIHGDLGIWHVQVREFR